MIPVAPRELRDLAYRCSRVAGVDPGAAHRLASNITFAEVHYGRAVEALARVVEAGDHESLQLFSAAADAVERAEVELGQDGTSVARFERPVPFAAVAESVWEAANRGRVAADLPSDIVGSTSCVEIRLVGGPQSESGGVQSTKDAFVERHKAGCRNGLSISRTLLDVLETGASLFLVEEAVLDRIDQLAN